jgi:hydrogenase maturation factor
MGMQLVTGTLVEIGEEDGLHVGRMRVDGALTRVVLTLVPEARVGDGLLAHAGVALSRLVPPEQTPAP